LFSFLGLALIIISVVFFDNRKIPPFPNCYTLIPTCGATLIILFGDKNTIVGYLLSTRLLRWIGLISYSAYLWHQPLLAFIRLQSNQILPMSTIIIVISVIFPLSILSYVFVEQPFRNKNRFSQKQIFSIAGLAFVISFFLGLYLIQTANIRSLMVNKGGDSYLSDLQKYGNQKYVGKNFNDLTKTNTFSNDLSGLQKYGNRKYAGKNSKDLTRKTNTVSNDLFDLRKHGNRKYVGENFNDLAEQKNTF
jgi:glucan phosphoethanolaminetransferase (alkaline phosphatase superfamily)